MNVNEIAKDIMSKEPDREVKEIYKLDYLYLVVAPHKGIKGIDYSDPYFIYNEKNRKHEPFIPSENFKFYEKITQNKVYPIGK